MSSNDPIFFVRVSPTGEQPEPVDQSSRIMTMEFEEDEKMIDKAKLTVDNYDLSNFDAPIWKHGNHVELTWGYPGNLSIPRQIKIQKVTGSLILQIECYGEGVLLNKKGKVKHHRGKKRSDVAVEIAKAYGFTSRRMYIKDTEIVLDQVTQAGLTDMQLLKDMARREGFEFYVDHNGFHFKPADYGQAPVRSYVYFTDPGRGDILTWNVDKDIFSGGKTGAVHAKGINPATKALIDTAPVHNATDPSRTTLGSTVGLIAQVGEWLAVGGGEITFHKSEAAARAAGSAIFPTSEKTEVAAKKHAVGTFRKAEMMAVSLVMECRGDPRAHAKQVIEVQGIGKTISGNYYVTSVNHKVGSGYTMTVKCKRSGDGSGVSAAGQDFKKEKPKPPEENKGTPNTQKPGVPHGLQLRVIDGVATYTDGKL